MHVDTKIRLVKYLGDKRNRYQDHIKRSVLGDIIFNKFIGSELIDSDDFIFFLCREYFDIIVYEIYFIF